MICNVWLPPELLLDVKRLFLLADSKSTYSPNLTTRVSPTQPECDLSCPCQSCYGQQLICSLQIGLLFLWKQSNRDSSLDQVNLIWVLPAAANTSCSFWTVAYFWPRDDFSAGSVVFMLCLNSTRLGGRLTSS